MRDDVVMHTFWKKSKAHHLFESENGQRFREKQEGYFSFVHGAIVFISLDFLWKDGLTRDDDEDLWKRGEIIFLREKARISQGGCEERIPWISSNLGQFWEKVEFIRKKKKRLIFLSSEIFVIIEI